MRIHHLFGRVVGVIVAVVGDVDRVREICSSWPLMRYVDVSSLPYLSVSRCCRHDCPLDLMKGMMVAF